MATLYVGDSIFKYLKVEDAEVRSLSGAKTEDLLPMLKDVSSFDNLVLHVGTNDLSRRSVAESLEGFVNLLSVVRTRAPSVQIFLSAILPRAFSEFPGAVNSSGRIDGLNVRATGLNRELRKLEDVQVIDHPRFGYHRMDVRRYLLSRDGLHLSPSGLRVLHEDLTTTVQRDGMRGGPPAAPPAEEQTPEDWYTTPSFSVEDFPPLPVANPPTHTYFTSLVTITPAVVPTLSHTIREVTNADTRTQPTVAVKPVETQTPVNVMDCIRTKQVKHKPHSRTIRKVNKSPHPTKVSNTSASRKVTNTKPHAIRTQSATSVRPVVTHTSPAVLTHSRTERVTTKPYTLTTHHTATEEH